MYKQETDRQRETQRDTERQTGRQAGRDRQRLRQRRRERERQRQRQTDRQTETETDRDRDMIQVKQCDDKLEKYLDVVPSNRNKAMPSIQEKQTTSRSATLLFKNTRSGTLMLLSSIKHRFLTFCLYYARVSSVTPDPVQLMEQQPKTIKYQ